MRTKCPLDLLSKKVLIKKKNFFFVWKIRKNAIRQNFSRLMEGICLPKIPSSHGKNEFKRFYPLRLQKKKD